MDEKRTGREEHLPAEVVEVYSRPLHREVVERYERPLPASMLPPAAPPPGPARGQKRSRRRGFWVFLAVFVLILAVAAAVWAWERSREGTYERDPFDYVYDQAPEQLEEFQGNTIATYPWGQGAELTVYPHRGSVLAAREVYERVNPAVVTVVAHRDESWASIGTGVVFREDGYILTNEHVLDGTAVCTVYFGDDRSYPALYVAGDANSDLAVLKVDLTGLVAAEFGDSEELVVGDPVYAIGTPLGYELRGTLTDGIVSAINRDMDVNGRTMTLIQTNAALNSGNSGGPLINEYGQVVGINVIKMTSAYSTVEGLGFAIPSGAIRRLVNDLLTHGQVQPEPLLGLSVLPMSDQLKEALWGIRVEEMVSGGAAEKAGVQIGDYVLEAGGIETRSSRDLLRARQQYRVGEQMPMTLWRNGEILEVMLLLEQAVGED